MKNIFSKNKSSKNETTKKSDNVQESFESTLKDLLEKESPAKQSGLQKAAHMIFSLGEDQAAKVLQHMNPGDIEKIMKAVVHIKATTPAQKEKAMGEIAQSLQKNTFDQSSGIDQARSILQQAFGEERANAHLDKITRSSIGKKNSPHTKELESHSPDIVAEVLSFELPRTSALILSMATPAFSAKVFKNLDNGYRVQVARKIADMERISPDIINTVFTSVLKKLQTMAKQKSEKVGGENKLSEILAFLDRDMEESILNSIHDDDPVMVQRLREKLRTFEDVIGLNKKEIRLLLDQIPDLDVWGKALKGAGAELLSHLFSSISQNRAKDIKEAMGRFTPISMKEVSINRKTVMEMIDSLENKGSLILHKHKENLIDK
jgi:flagellar motor switch protein FliG